ncbi:MAG: hypothetical protein Q7K29_07165 [Thermoleophilia bacterium]|nr:hypothetical protein [Thermoleophilia bacterium]
MARMPLKPMKIYSALSETRDLSDTPARVLVTGSDLDAVQSVYEALIPGAAAGQASCLVDAASGTDVPPLSQITENDVIILVSAPADIDSDSFRSRLSEAEAVDAPVVVVLTEAPGVQVSFPGVGPRRVVGMAPGGIPPADVLAEAVADAAGDSGVALAAKLPALRDEVCRQLIHRTARQNAVVGCLFIIPGADMPVMTLNEARMILRMAAAHGETVGSERALELLGIVGTGFGLRAVARQALDFFPGPGWVIKGGIAWSGTRALGEAAKAYFDGSVRVTPSRLAPLVDKLKKLRG